MHLERQVRFHNRTQALSTQHRMLNPHVTPPVSPPMNITHCVECIGCGRLGAGQVIQSDTEASEAPRNPPQWTYSLPATLSKPRQVLYYTILNSNTFQTDQIYA